jgi:adenosylcobinamide kinase / adenosylcobinamide-phosphate guanylyltransferase
MGGITLIVGGARSGKSSFALKRALKVPEKRVFVATAVAFDQEMTARIEKHKQERETGFVTVEESYELGRALLNLQSDTAIKIVLVDCLTVWLGNLFHYHSTNGEKIGKKIDELFAAISGSRSDLILVANEVGLGVVPETSMGREFRDIAGRLNQEIAEIADKVYLCVCGIPVAIK